MNIKTYINQIDQLRKEQDAIFHDVAVKFGLSDTTLWILYMMTEMEDTCTQQTLCRESFFPKQTVNSSIASLVKSGYAELEAIPGTRNQKRVLLTEQGEELAQQTVTPLAGAEQRAYSTLTEEELEVYLKLTSRLTVSLREETERMIFDRKGGEK